MSVYDTPVLTPGSPDEAVEAFGDGKGVTLLAGGTIVVPDIVFGRLKPERVVALHAAGLDRITREGGRVTIGAGVRVSELEGGDEPLAEAARAVGDPEVRGQATVGGNLCAGPGRDTPRGDLGAPLIALGGQVRSAGAGGERTDAVEDFLGNATGRLVLDVSYDDVSREAGYAAAWRHHTHHYSILTVAAVRANGELRVAAGGAGPYAVRLRSVEASGNAEDALKDVNPQDDAVASAWYRKKILPRLVEQALASL
jgi:CO/xanthine dehydrogenase FAD-binding subunit